MSEVAAELRRWTQPTVWPIRSAPTEWTRRRAVRRGAGALPGARRLRARGRAREESSPASAFSPEQMDGDVGTLSGGWKMRVALGRSCSPARRPAARRADELPRPRVDPLARGVPARLPGPAADDVPRPRDHEPRRQEDRRDRRRRADELLAATTTSTSSSAR